MLATQPLRYWIAATIHSLTIRVEWSQGTTVGTVCEDGSVSWGYGPPPESMLDTANECAMSAGEWEVHGASYEGNETAAEMARQVEARCSACSVVQESTDALSDEGFCSLCWVEAMGRTERVEPLGAEKLMADATSRLLEGCLPRWRICSERKTRAGIATEDAGLILHAPDAETAVANARRLPMLAGLRLVAIAEAA